MLHITLGEERSVDPEVDELGRDRVGFSPSMSQGALYDANHGCWKLGPRAQKERYMLVSFAGEVRQAIEIESIEPVARGGRSVVHGTILREGHWVYDKYVGKSSHSGRVSRLVRHRTRHGEYIRSIAQPGLDPRPDGSASLHGHLRCPGLGSEISGSPPRRPGHREVGVGRW